jgi:hypothetical protein
MTDDILHSYHWVQNDTEIFLEFNPLHQINQYLSNNQWILFETSTNKFYTYGNSFVNTIDEWNPAKLGWFRRRDLQNTGMEILMPANETLARYLDIKTVCKREKFSAVFHGVTNPTNLEKHGKISV